MKVTEIKSELEKVSKVIPELRDDLNKVYTMGPGKKSQMKLLWKQYENKYKEIRDSKVYKTLQ
jgi:hypothetical protein